MRVRLWSHEPPGTLAYGLILALGGSSNPQGPYDMPKKKGHKGNQKEKRAKKAPHQNSIKMAIVMARTQNTQEGPKWPKTIVRPNFKDNGDKPLCWMIPKANQGEENPRGPISWPIMGIYIDIPIIHPFFEVKRSNTLVLGYNPRFISLKEELIEIQKKSIIQSLRNLFKSQRRVEDR
ncbi:hypothetical protein O181_078189 [Austropuccinia psidii MF-1]|uniref:Uncharacterized protein n=1 Tax=Austropuccinia psidii MF-1 TaxID=1389203 RepID=A0A9Q3FGF6_9BASI|nr:hypothetical protein [Austropuccinia psidii MF-1]